MTLQIPCGNSTLGWNFKEGTYKGMDDFTLQLEYGFIDNSYASLLFSTTSDQRNT
jgi:hypothetical protein